MVTKSELEQAFFHHQRGELAHAEPLYRAALAATPGHSGALHMLGLLQHQQGRHREAADLIRAAIAIDPGQAAAHSNLALALQELGDFGGALASCDRALALAPGYPEALNNRGNALRQLQRDDEALASYERALARRPDYADALANSGDVLRVLRRHGEALVRYDRLLALAPGRAENHYRRGNVLAELTRAADAVASYDRVLALEPAHVGALINRGIALHQLSRLEEALASFDHALALRPDSAHALNNRGNVLLDLKRPSDALASYDRALALEPRYVEALGNRTVVLLELRRAQEALHNCDQLLALRPDDVDALASRGHALYLLKRFDDAAEAYMKLVAVAPDCDYVAGTLLRCRLLCCDWTGVEELTRDVENAVERGRRAVPPFAFLVNSRSPSAQLQCARTYVADRCPPSARPLAAGRRYRHDRIRVAYLSTKFREHAGAHLAAGLFEGHDRRRFETTAISFGPAAEGAMRERLMSAFDRFVDVRATNAAAVAHLLAAAEIDIAVDLVGHAADSRPGILAHRPAPIQVNFLGFPGTLGAEYIDYIIADRCVIPPEDDAFYTEKVVRLPDTYQVNDRKRRIAERTPTRTEAGLPEAGFVFCCFNNNYKIAPDIFAIWMRLLSRVEGSVLWLLHDNAAASANLRREAGRRGVAPERLVFAPREDLALHLARHRLADLFVDTLPYNAHTTASDALWAGLPVVTCLGSTFAGRVAASLLHAAGLPELVTRTREDYEALALQLATTPALLSAARARLADQRLSCPLFDTDRFRRHIESAYTTMWERLQRGEPPAGFAVEAIA